MTLISSKQWPRFRSQGRASIIVLQLAQTQTVLMDTIPQWKLICHCLLCADNYINEKANTKHLKHVAAAGWRGSEPNKGPASMSPAHESAQVAANHLNRADAENREHQDVRHVHSCLQHTCIPHTDLSTNSFRYDRRIQQMFFFLIQDMASFIELISRARGNSPHYMVTFLVWHWYGYSVWAADSINCR